MSANILGRVIAITNAFRPNGDDPACNFQSETAVCQDAMIFGIDVDDYVDSLEAEFGTVVRTIPWLRFTDQVFSFRGSGVLLLPVVIIWRLMRWPFVGGSLLPKADPQNFPHRLTLGHIAAVIKNGEWFDP